MNNRQMLFALHHMQGIGYKTIYRLLETFTQLSEMLQFTKEDWIGFGLGSVKAEQLCRGLSALDAEAITNKERQYAEKGIEWVTFWDEAYPKLLKETADQPWIMYYMGDLALASLPCIGMVGTRTPTAYGKMTAEKLAASLSANGVCVVSGLARGIDSAAHEGALTGIGSTIAVLGCSIEEIYPPENKLLYRKIASQGVLLSEYPLGTKSHPGLFPQRNRVIAGLSLGVVVVEAALRSGSLITADQALDESRDVFAVPGPISSPKSQGTLSLLKQGAKLVTGPEDILEEYADRIGLERSANIKTIIGAPSPLKADEQQIFDLLVTKPMSIDVLKTQSQFTFGHLHSVLINLLMMRRIVELPGSVYTVP
ncbi:DNA-processing protein DprA [Paenibacillus cremeus]|uniref:DNA-protecting protein DprA n=1 Tax=Paenibacillus cremeus TaxID=2163881 RepID=A0A559KEW8_9BACL|nr:DNA-processing protein DprA [Paenibacillus cremeus]TVY10666.1 DNA-protecting protein DprA [Paenibacillus cremeus]